MKILKETFQKRKRPEKWTFHLREREREREDKTSSAYE